MCDKNVIKKFKYILNIPIFIGILPISFSWILFSNVKNLVGENISTSDEYTYFNDKVLKYKNQNNEELFISIRSNPMNNFVSLTTTEVGAKSIEEQFTYVLCDTAHRKKTLSMVKIVGL